MLSFNSICNTLGIFSVSTIHPTRHECSICPKTDTPESVFHHNHQGPISGSSTKGQETLPFFLPKMWGTQLALKDSTIHYVLIDCSMERSGDLCQLVNSRDHVMFTRYLKVKAIYRW